MRLARNVVANIVQTVIGAALLFALYRYINVTLGAEKLGVWSVILATISVSRLTDFGLSGSVTRFVARDRARGRLADACKVIDTTTLTLAVTIGVLLPVMYPAIKAVLPHFLQGGALSDSIAILPYALASLWLGMLSLVVQSGLDGCERMDLRSSLVVLGQGVLLAAAIFLLPRYGLVGLVIAQIVQALFVLILGRFLLRRSLSGLSWLPRFWDRKVFRELLGYGTNVQAASIAMILFDATTKVLMARFGGAAAAGHFEMANQVVVKVRAVIVAANQAVVPHVATISEQEPARLRRFHRANIRLLVYFSIPVFTLLFAWSGGFSWLLVGKYQPQVAALIWIVGAAWLVNIFSGPAYFTNLGTGHVERNTIAHVVIGVANVTLGWVLGKLLGVSGVAIGYAIALIGGSIVLLATFRPPKVDKAVDQERQSILGEDRWMLAACSAVVAFAWLTPLRPGFMTNASLAVGVLLPPLLLALVMWFHPLRRRLIHLLRRPAVPLSIDDQFRT